MKQRTVKHNIDGLAALLLFGIFAACVLSVLLSGAGAYRRLTQRDLTAYDRRTGLQYIAARVRQADRQGAVTVEGSVVPLSLIMWVIGAATGLSTVFVLSNTFSSVTFPFSS